MSPVIDMGEYMDVARTVGLMRSHENRRAGRPDLRSKPSDDPELLDYIGAVGELAFSLWSGLPWSGAYLEGEALRNFKKRGHPDVGDCYHVRTRPNMSYDLPVYPRDPGDHFMVLALLDTNSYEVTLRGWYPIGAAKREENWARFLPKPNYLVRQSDLMPMEVLPL